MKKRAIIGALAALLAVGAVNTGWKAWQETSVSIHRFSVEERIVSSTVFLMNSDENSGGSGVLIRRGGKWYCWTAAHVAKIVANDGIAIVRVFDQGVLDTRARGKVARVVAASDKLDLAVLELSVPELGQQSAVLSQDTLTLGQPIINCGHARGPFFPWNLVTGVISQVPGESNAGLLENGKYLAVSTSSYPGCSGSGIWTTDGKLAGILSWGGGPGLVGFVHNEVMVQFAVENSLQWVL